MAAKKLNTQLSKAEALCQRRGVHLTPLRAAVMELIYHSPAAVGAYEILRLLRQTRPNAEAATVYRVLDFLLQQHLIHRVESLNAYIPCSHQESAHQSQFLLCRCCGKAVEILDPAVIRAIKKCLDSQGFVIEHGITEIQGVCYNCKQNVSA